MICMGIYRMIKRLKCILTVINVYIPHTEMSLPEHQNLLSKCRALIKKRWKLKVPSHIELLIYSLLQ